MLGLYSAVFCLRRIISASEKSVYSDFKKCIRGFTGTQLKEQLRCQLISVCPWSLHPQGDLGAIDDKYDVAISSSCGALDHIVVDTIDTAQACVNFLKAGGIGVATFIALDKVRKQIIVLLIAV